MIVVLFILGLMFGSFINALVWRVHKKKDFVRERSQCPHCGHILAPRDLIPVISYVLLKGSCRYCHRRISAQYPLVEIICALVFSLSFVFWPTQLSGGGDYLLLVTWLATSIGLIALAVYDLKWMLLPNKILYPTLAIAAAGHFIYLLVFSSDRLFYALNWLLSILIASGIFYLLFIVSEGRWIGFGDVRLGLITGTVLHKPALALLMIFMSAVLGSLVSLPLMLAGKKKLYSMIPYGPFLIIATYICLIFGQSIIDWYQGLFLG